MIVLIIKIAIFLAIAGLAMYFTFEFFEKDRTPFDIMYRWYEFLFDRWTYTKLDWGFKRMLTKEGKYLYTIEWVTYKKVNKFNGKIKYPTKEYKMYTPNHTKKKKYNE
jgi:hypothetical protein